MFTNSPLSAKSVNSMVSLAAALKNGNPPSTHSIVRTGLEACSDAMFSSIGNVAAQLSATALEVISFEEKDPLFLAIQAHLLLRRGYASEALPLIEEAAKLEPNNKRRQIQLANFYQMLMENPQEPGHLRCGYLFAETLRKILRIDPNDKQIRLYLIQHLRIEEMHKQAYEIAKDTQNRFPRDASAAFQLASTEHALGDKEEALRHFHLARKLNPHDALFWRATYEVFPGAHDAQSEAFLRAKLKTSLPPTERVEYLFALGNILDAKGRYDKAFGIFHEAQTLNARIYFPHAYDHEKDKKVIESIRNHRKQIRERKGLQQATEGRVPIFVCGLPRSGTTLIQHILANHTDEKGENDVYAGGELSHLPRAFLLFQAAQGRLVQMSGQDPGIMERTFEGLARAYKMSVAEQFSLESKGSITHVVDKTPQNALNIELIRLLFPDARIILCRRNVLDTFVSIFKRNLGHQEGMRVYGNMEIFAKWYCEYYKPWIDFWTGVLPSHQLLEVQYEDLVKNPGAVVPQIFSFCNLSPQSEGIVQRPDSERLPIPNATEYRARLPIYRSSLGTWRRYERHLEPLRRLIADTDS